MTYELDINARQSKVMIADITPCGRLLKFISDLMIELLSSVLRTQL